jgi:hypothetical protein
MWTFSQLIGLSLIGSSGSSGLSLDYAWGLAFGRLGGVGWGQVGMGGAPQTSAYLCRLVSKGELSSLEVGLSRLFSRDDLMLSCSSAHSLPVPLPVLPTLSKHATTDQLARLDQPVSNAVPLAG